MISKGRVTRLGIFFALINLAFTAFIGFLLRYHMIWPLEWLAERNWIHAHSHTGFLGWVFIVIATLAFYMMIPKSARINKKMHRLIVYLQIVVAGMAATFPLMGYDILSILFSSIHMVLAIIFMVMFFVNTNPLSVPVRYMRAGLIFMAISCLGPLALGPIMGMGLKNSPYYDLAIYFYLHFQYNGWFTMAVLGLLFQFLEDRQFFFLNQRANQVYLLMVAGIILTLPLSFLGIFDETILRVFGLSGALCQLVAGFLVLHILFVKPGLGIALGSRWVRLLFLLALSSWLFKSGLQFISAMPFAFAYAFLSRDAIIMYLHLVFLGFATCFMLGMLLYARLLIVKSWLAHLGLFFIVAGILFTEIAIGLKAIPTILSLTVFHLLNPIIFIASAVLLMGILLIILFAFMSPRQDSKQALST